MQGGLQKRNISLHHAIKYSRKLRPDRFCKRKEMRKAMFVVFFQNLTIRSLDSNASVQANVSIPCVLSNDIMSQPPYTTIDVP